jgi:cephalosporin hydroxylase
VQPIRQSDDHSKRVLRMTTLIFPAGMPRAIAFLNDCLKNKLAVVGASSLMQDPCRVQYPKWAYLPYVNAPDFAESLLEAIQREGIRQIFSPNPVVWDVLKSTLQTIAPDVELLGESPAAEMLSGFRSSKRVSDELWQNRDFLSLGAQGAKRMHKEEFAALVHHAETIPGMCDHQKLLALSEVLRFAPHGDVVEIGSWWGKSAFILAHLACRYEIGSLLCVDPWSDSHLVQGDKLVDELSAEVSAEEAHAVFITNLLPYSRGNINFIRATSVEGALRYRANSKVETDAFGVTRYAGKIALFHIDGNHEESAVSADLEAWGSLVMAGGWIVFDDYRWPYGIGPRVVADRFVQERKREIGCAFYMGGALFVQLAERLST